MTTGRVCGTFRPVNARLPVLDGFRAIAVLIVMASHGFTDAIPGGFGVTIFFFLSGYLITTLMVKEWDLTGRVDFAAFYLRRVVRIVPPMLIAIAVTVALSAAGLVRPIDYLALPWDLLFLTNYVPESRIPIPLWSLDVEEHFYLLFPLLFAMVRGRGSVALTCVLLCAAVLLARVAHVVASGPVDGIFYWSHTRIDSILFGCILATWNNPATGDRTRIGDHIGFALLGAALILATFAIRDPVFRETLRYSVQGVGLLLIFNYALRNAGLPAKALSHRGLAYVGAISYFLYLIHMPMIEFAERIDAPVPAAFFASVLLAEAVRRYVEKPLLAWRKRIEAQPGVKVSAI